MSGERGPPPSPCFGPHGAGSTGFWVRSGIKKSKSKYWKGKRRAHSASLNRYTGFRFQRFDALMIQRGEAACQTNPLMAKFCPDEARIDFLCDVPFRVALPCFGSNVCVEAS